jgi:actin-related protein
MDVRATEIRALAAELKAVVPAWVDDTKQGVLSSDMETEYSIVLRKLQTLKDMRAHQLEGLSGNIKSLLTCLGDGVPDIGPYDQLIQDGKEQEIPLHIESIGILKRREVQLLRLKDERQKQMFAEHEKLTKLCGELFAGSGELDAFSEALLQRSQTHGKYSQEALNMYRQEMERLRDVKVTKLPELIAKVRIDIRKLWDKLQLGTQERFSFKSMFDSIYTKEALAIHEAEFDRLAADFKTKAPVFQLMDTRATIRQDIKATHKKSRFSLSSTSSQTRQKTVKGNPVYRSKESEMKELTDKFCEVSMELTGKVEAWELTFTPRKFTVNGTRLLDTLRDENERFAEFAMKNVVKASASSSSSASSSAAKSRRQSFMSPSPGPKAMARKKSFLSPSPAPKSKRAVVKNTSTFLSPKASSLMSPPMSRRSRHPRTQNNVARTPKMKLNGPQTPVQPLIRSSHVKNVRSSVTPKRRVPLSSSKRNLNRSSSSVKKPKRTPHKHVNVKKAVSTLEEQARDDSSDDEEEHIIVIAHEDHTISMGDAETETYQPTHTLLAPTFSDSSFKTLHAASGLPRTANEKHWTKVQAVWTRMFASMQINPGDCSFVVTQSADNDVQQQKIYEMLFEHFHARAVHVAQTPLLVAYAYGVFTGLIVQVTHERTSVTPIVDGFIINSGVRTAPHLSCNNMNDALMRRLRTSNTHVVSSMSTAQLLKLCDKIRKENAFCALDYKAALTDPAYAHRELSIDSVRPGSTLKLTDELFSIAELLFQPDVVLGDGDLSSLADLILDSVQSCSIDCRQSLLSSICPSGDGSMLVNFPERLTAELKDKLPRAATYIAVKADPNRNHSVWSGGAILSSLPDFPLHVKLYHEYVEETMPDTPRAKKKRQSLLPRYTSTDSDISMDQSSEEESAFDDSLDSSMILSDLDSTLVA